MHCKIIVTDSGTKLVTLINCGVRLETKERCKSKLSTSVYGNGCLREYVNTEFVLELKLSFVLNRAVRLSTRVSELRLYIAQ